ncbi:hypothetical protein [Streptomyces sp. SID9124]|uniref:hypothetical protein n=1 Tax=Streptomyces sp. SID9124 TaxID=2706108 RepID=UPI00194197F3|nr:hypothetical protein [Streptomyces sp. SID9124]
MRADVLPQLGLGERHQATREGGTHALRHFFMSALLDTGQNIKALSTYIGRSDPGFTLRIYTPHAEQRWPNPEGRGQ